MGSQAEPCSITESRIGACESISSSLGDGRATLGASTTSGGDADTSAPVRHDAASRPGSAPTPQPTFTPCSGELAGHETSVYCATDPATPAPTPGAGAGVTIRDVANFPVQAGTITSEPARIAILKLPTNFTSTASSQTITGTLLGRPAAVRFTPAAFHYNYGDGSTRDTTTPGKTWAALGTHELTPTATSHSYTTRGDYSVTLTVDYTADYAWGDSAFHHIPGTLRVNAPTITLHTASVTTVNVANDCTTDPSGPGCQ